MWRGSVGLIAAVLALTGCRSTADPKPTDRDPRGSTAARSRDAKGQGPAWLDPVAKMPGAGTGVPRAPSWTDDPKNPDFDARAESRDGLSGRVVDAFNRPAKNVFVRVEAVSDSPGGKGIGIYSDGNGYFSTRGLKPGTAYNLTAEAKQDGKQLTGVVQTRVPSSALTIVLREGQGLPPEEPAPAGGRATQGFPPPPVPTGSDHIPPAGVGSPPRSHSDGAFRPGGGASSPAPAAIGGAPVTGSPPPAPGTGGGLPEPDDLTTPEKPVKPENVAEGPKTPFTPPAANIPGPPVPTPRLPVPPPSPPGGGQSRGAGNFRLIDTLERDWDFATTRAGSVVLVEFVTTNCPHCKPAVPVLKDLQSRYAAGGLEVVAVLCDEVPVKQRVAAAAKYAKENNTNYSVFVEPGAKPGAVRDALGVESYPRAVLLAADGTVLWNGHPGDKAKLEAAVRRALGK